jgi:hypothetical protein
MRPVRIMRRPVISPVVVHAPSSPHAKPTGTATGGAARRPHLLRVVC